MNSSPQEVEQMVQQGWDFLHEEAFEDARIIAEQLISQTHQEGYRILAEIYRIQELPADAISILRDAVKKLDQQWELYLDLGNVLSESGNPKEAIEVYQQAKALSSAEPHWLEINEAAARFRLGEIDEALTQLQQIKEPKAIGEAFLMQLTILEAISRQDLIIEIAEEELEAIPAPNDEETAQTLSKICTKIATAAFYQDGSKEMVKHYLQQGIFFFRENEEALWLLRELNPQYSDNSRMYVLLLSGRFAITSGEEEVVEEFMSSYGVIADNTDEAMDLIRSFEMEIEEVDLDSLTIEEVDEAENEDDDPKGLYFVSGFGVLEAEEE